ALHALDPPCGALESVGCSDVEHQVAVNDADELVVTQIDSEFIGMTRTGATVATQIQVPAPFRGDNAKVLAVHFGTVSGASGNRGLHLVRRAQTAVAQLQMNRHGHRILHAISAPSRPDARFNGTQSLAVGMTRFETGIYQAL